MTGDCKSRTLLKHLYIPNGEILGTDVKAQAGRECKKKNEELRIYLSDLISCQHNDISPFMKALGGSQVTNALGKGKEEHKVCF